MLAWICISEKHYNVAFDFIKLLGMILIIKGISFYFTLLPDSSQKCDLSNMFKSQKGCNDLLFSSHITVQLLSILYILYYTRFGKGMSTNSNRLLISTIPINAYLILALRDHYSIDILYALIVTYGMFYFNHTCFKPGLLCKDH